MSWFSVTYTFSPSTTIRSSEANQNFSDIVAGINTAMPSKGVIMFSGEIADIPSGWYLCDGNNSTPDLRDKFIMGAGGTYDVGDTGGNASINLYHRHQVNSHGHNFASEGDHGHNFSSEAPGTSGVGDHAHSYSGSTDYEGGTSQPKGTSNNTCAQEDHRHTYSGVTSNAGAHSHTVNSHSHGFASQGAHSHNFAAESPYTDYQLSSSQSIINPFYALALIKKS